MIHIYSTLFQSCNFFLCFFYFLYENMRCLHRAVFRTLSSIQTAFSKIFPKNLHNICLVVKEQQVANVLQKSIFKNFAIFTGKHLRQSLILIRLQALRNRLQHSCSPVNIKKFLRTVFLQNTSGGCLWHGPKYVSVYILNNWFS